MQLRISKISSYLFTRIAFQTCSGLPGTLLTNADAAAASMASANVVGPPKLGLFMNSVVAYSDRSFDAVKLEVNVRVPARCSWHALCLHPHAFQPGASLAKLRVITRVKHRPLCCKHKKTCRCRSCAGQQKQPIAGITSCLSRS